MVCTKLFRIQSVSENDPLLTTHGITGGYPQSKWVAEKLLQAARDQLGIPVAVYRPGYSIHNLIKNVKFSGSVVEQFVFFSEYLEYLFILPSHWFVDEWSLEHGRFSLSFD